MNIIERIGIEQHEIGCLISFDGADSVEFSKEFRCVASGCFKRLHRTETSIYQIRELIVDRAVLSSGWQVRPRQESHTSPLHHVDNFRIPGKQAVSPAKILGCILHCAISP